jgi:hypothetical protein
LGDEWSVINDQLEKEGPAAGQVGFGDPDWTDYDLTFQARKSAGPHGFGCVFRASEGKFYLLQVGCPDNKHYLDHFSGGTLDKRIDPTPGTIQPLEWYTVKVVLRRQDIRVELEGQLLFECEDDFQQRGAVSLCFFEADGRFRNIMVTSPDGIKLWEGVPDLP